MHQQSWCHASTILLVAIPFSLYVEDSFGNQPSPGASLLVQKRLPILWLVAPAPFEAGPWLLQARSYNRPSRETDYAQESTSCKCAWGMGIGVRARKRMRMGTRLRIALANWCKTAKHGQYRQLRAGLFYIHGSEHPFVSSCYFITHQGRDGIYSFALGHYLKTQQGCTS